jgi:hypothetical protein
MNGLSSSVFPYSLNNLQVITTSDGGTLPVSVDVPLIKTLTSTNQNINLYESSPDIIDFNTFDKSLRVKELFASTGSFNNIYSTGARFLTLNATGINCNSITATTSIISNGSLNAPNANITCFGINAIDGIIRTTNGFTGPFITASSGTFQNLNTNTLTANTININTVNIPNLSFNIATGVNASITNINNTSFTGGFMNFNTGSFSGLTGSNLFVNNLTATNSVFSASSMNAPAANISCFGVSPTSFVFSPFYTGARAELGSITANTGIFNNISSTGMNLNNLTFTTATGVNAAITNIVNTNFTGGFMRFNTGSFDGLTGTNLFVNNITSSGIVFTTATGGTLRSSVAIRNPQTLSFNKTDNTEIVRVEPGSLADVLSFYNPGGVLQTLYTTTSSGANVDNLNNLGTKDITNLSRIRNGDGTQALPSYSFVNDTDTGLYTEGSDTISLGLGNRRMTYFQPNLVSFGSGASNGVSVDIYGTLQVGGTSNANSALIDLGYSGSIFGVNNSRMGFITTNGTTLEINHQQAQTGSTSVGQISLIPGNDSNVRLLKQPNGILSNNSRNDGYGHQFTNLQTGGLGMITALPNKPDSAYLFSSQGPGFNSAITMHGSLGSQISNITVSRTNFPFTNNEYITCRPWTPTGSLSAGMKIANQVSETNGFTMFGMFATGATSGKPVSNYGYILNSNPLGGLAFFTNDNNVIPTTYPRYEIDASGNHIFSISSITGAFSITSFPYSVGIGTSFTSTRGQGRFNPVAVASLTNTTYTGGTEFLVRGSSSSNNDHSAFTTNQFSADGRGFYDIRYNLNLNTSTADDTVYVRIKVGGTTRQVSNHRIQTLPSNAQGSLLFNCTPSQLIELFIQGDTRNVNMNNDSTFTIMYVG